MAGDLAARLRREIAGEVLFSAADCGRYATDASIYQVEPVGVIMPRRIEDVMAALAICREAGVPVLPRGGGTSQCGQTVNRALVIDCSKHLRRVLSVDGDRALVEPGIVLGRLNAGIILNFDPVNRTRMPKDSAALPGNPKQRAARSLFFPNPATAHWSSYRE